MLDYATGFIGIGIDRLRKYFKKSLDDNQTEEIFLKLNDKCTDKNIFNLIISNLIESSRYFPTIREILNAYSQTFNNHIKTGKIKFTSVTTCNLCSGYGVLTVLQENDHEVGYSCSCEAGKNQSLPKYSDQRLKHNPDISLKEHEEKIFELLKKSNFYKVIKELAKRTSLEAPF